MNLDDLRQRRQARRARRHTGPVPWGTVSLVVGAAGLVAIYFGSRSCIDSQPDPVGPLRIQVSPAEIRVDGQVAVPVGDESVEAIEDALVDALAAHPPRTAGVEVSGVPGVNFSVMQAVARAVESAGLGPPRWVSPPADRLRE